MYKLAIVEDEKILLDDLENSTDWVSMGIEVVFTARNGASALKKIRMQPVDIIISDIKMPIMDGIEMAKEIRKCSPDIQLIFLTGYDDAEYMKSAIQVNVVSYLSKPFKEKDIWQAVNMAKERIALYKDAVHGRQNKKEIVLRKMLFSDFIDAEMFPDTYTLFLINIRKFNALLNNLSAAELNQIIEDTKNKIEEFLSYRVKEYVVIYLPMGSYLILADSNYNFFDKASDDLNELNGKLDQSTHLRIFISKDSIFISSHQFRWAFKKIINIYKNSFYINFDEYVISSCEWEDVKFETTDMGEQKQILLKDLLKMDEEIIAKDIQTYFNIIKSHKLQRENIISDCYELCCKILDSGAMPQKDAMTANQTRGEILKRLEEYDSIYQIENYVTYMAYLILYREGGNAAEPIDEKKIVGNIIECIKRDFDKPISAESLMEQFYYAPSTIRTIFKKHTGKTIHEYLTDTRMRMAKELLENRKLKIKNLSAMVGYNNVSYFCTLFDKHYGMSPLKYRRLIGIAKEVVRSNE